ncbi:uncharacterized protein LOC124927688 [Impatiens glandulifera]|uniref:uncharacterized protein LOC124927688 n=1 Tax=Impatiens glandulifera TaxID=253017 RepID=UPI001FB0D47F|nr:uncharacterized protein LOC124927688 [Impatiens glandulifera]XP_047324099.1 uncharacterized protein LOC124927688 [Impatiens glandulifera]XP_047324100.1 uncharacterized protein LOC124927688 [Impatiens glandulifera]
MSGEAPGDLNGHLDPNGKCESLKVKDLVDTDVGHTKLEEKHKIENDSIVADLTNGNPSLNPGVEGGNSEVEYIDSENLTDVDNVEMSLKTFVEGLRSKEWILVCEALNDVRRLSIYHKEMLVGMLVEVIPLIVKSLKNPRSAVCKTAIMTSADIFIAYNDQLIDELDPMLLQLLLKSSQDKRFVCEAAERALIAMTTWLSPALLLPKLQPYLKNRNPRIRAKASLCFCRSVPRLGNEGIKAFGMDKLVEIAAAQLSDQLPESREAARTLLVELQSAYEKCQEAEDAAVVESSEKNSWEIFCQSKLSALNAQAVLRATTNIGGQEGRRQSSERVPAVAAV